MACFKGKCECWFNPSETMGVSLGCKKLYGPYLGSIQASDVFCFENCWKKKYDFSDELAHEIAKGFIIANHLPAEIWYYGDLLKRFFKEVGMGKEFEEYLMKNYASVIVVLNGYFIYDGNYGLIKMINDIEKVDPTPGELEHYKKFPYKYFVMEFPIKANIDAKFEFAEVPTGNPEFPYSHEPGLFLKEPALTLEIDHWDCCGVEELVEVTVVLKEEKAAK